MNGFLVPVHNIDTLVEKMTYLLEHPEENEKMAQNSLKIVKEKYDVDLVNEEIMKIMEIPIPIRK